MDKLSVHKPKKPKLNSKYILFIITAVLAVIGLSFYAGTYYQKKRDQKIISKYEAKIPAIPTFGKVTEISDKKITIKAIRNGEATSYSITKRTQVYNVGKKGSVDDIKKDQNVIILAVQGKPNEARRISTTKLPIEFNPPGNKSN